MPQSIKWLPEALDDVERLHEFLYEKDAGAASRAVVTILRGVDLLKTVPRLGRPLAYKSDNRDLFLTFGTGAYVLRYKTINDGSVIIIRVWHNREAR